MTSDSSAQRDLSRLGASKLVIRSGALLCQRRGSINPQDQSVGRYGGRSPENRGIWAFPFPYNDDFFNWHKWDEVIPKHLKNAAIEAVLAAEEDLPHEQSTTTALWAERDAWITKHANLLPVRRFWWQGDIWARFDRLGEIRFVDDKMIWNLLTPQEYARAARRAEPYALWTHDHMEIFLSPKQGRIVRR